MDSNFSFAFAFYYTEIERPFIDVTMKRGEDIVSCKYSVLTAKEKIKEWIKLMRIHNELGLINQAFVEKSLSQIFLKDVTSQMMTNQKMVEDRIAIELDLLMRDHNKQIEKYTEVKEVVSNLELKIKNELAESQAKAQKDITKLRQDIEIAPNEIRSIERKQKAREAKLIEENLLSQHKTTCKSCQFNLSGVRKKAYSILDDCSLGLSRQKQKIVKDKFANLIKEKLE